MKSIKKSLLILIFLSFPYLLYTVDLIANTFFFDRIVSYFTGDVDGLTQMLILAYFIYPTYSILYLGYVIYLCVFKKHLHKRWIIYALGIIVLPAIILILRITYYDYISDKQDEQALEYGTTIQPTLTYTLVNQETISYTLIINNLPQLISEYYARISVEPIHPINDLAYIGSDDIWIHTDGENTYYSDVPDTYNLDMPLNEYEHVIVLRENSVASPYRFYIEIDSQSPGNFYNKTLYRGYIEAREE